MNTKIQSLIKKCVLEVLQKSLLEGFDPTSAGPRPEATNGTQNNPYPAFNDEMRKMEEGSFGNAFNDNFDGSDKEALERNYPYGSKNNKMRQMESNENLTFSTKTFREIKNQLDPDGTKHDLTLTCSKCGTSETCRCSKPKRKIKGICDKCANT